MPTTATYLTCQAEEKPVSQDDEVVNEFQSQLGAPLKNRNDIFKFNVIEFVRTIEDLAKVLRMYSAWTAKYFHQMCKGF